MAKYSVSYTNSRGVVSTCIANNLAKATLNTLPHGVKKFDGRMASVTVGLVRREDGTLLLAISDPGETLRIYLDGTRISGPSPCDTCASNCNESECEKNRAHEIAPFVTADAVDLCDHKSTGRVWRAGSWYCDGCNEEAAPEHDLGVIVGSSND